jgi:hypothetical protein
MSTQIPSQPAKSPGLRETPWVRSFAMFAGALMLVAGVYHVLAGVAALVHDVLFVSTPEYIYAFDITGWGWAHMVLGVVVGAAGVAVLQGRTWARVVGIILAGLSLIANFLFIPYYPIWSMVIIALDIIVIWALALYHRELA